MTKKIEKLEIEEGWIMGALGLAETEADSDSEVVYKINELVDALNELIDEVNKLRKENPNIAYEGYESILSELSTLIQESNEKEDTFRVGVTLADFFYWAYQPHERGESVFKSMNFKEWLEMAKKYVNQKYLSTKSDSKKLEGENPSA